jgi:hypothetical protein
MSRPKKDVTPKMLGFMRGNTEYWMGMFPRYTTEAFLEQARHYLANCHARLSNATYEDAIVSTVLPEALARIEELEKSLADLRLEIAAQREHYEWGGDEDDEGRLSSGPVDFEKLLKMAGAE